MQKSKLAQLITASSIAALVFLLAAGCSKKTEQESQPQNAPVNTQSQTAPDPRMIIQGFQQALEPAGQPLTEEQQKRIMEVYNPAVPDDMRPVYGVFTKEQKNIFVNILREQLSQTKFPLTQEQESRIISMGPGSKEKSWLEVFTPEQMQMIMGIQGSSQ